MRYIPLPEKKPEGSTCSDAQYEIHKQIRELDMENELGTIKKDNYLKAKVDLFIKFAKTIMILIMLFATQGCGHTKTALGAVNHVVLPTVDCAIYSNKSAKEFFTCAGNNNFLRLLAGFKMR